MSQYVKYLICYDVPSDKVRRKLFEKLKDLGLRPIQKSVFYGDLKPPEVVALGRLVRELLDSKTDKCFWFPCHLDEQAMRACLGYENFEDLDPDGHGFL